MKVLVLSKPGPGMLSANLMFWALTGICEKKAEIISLEQVCSWHAPSQSDFFGCRQKLVKQTSREY